MGPTADAWLHRTSFSSISRVGTESAWAPAPSTRLRLVWKALVPDAPFSTRISPRYTECELCATAPLNSRSDVVCLPWWDCKVAKSCIWWSAPKNMASCRLAPPAPPGWGADLPHARAENLHRHVLETAPVSHVDFGDGHDQRRHIGRGQDLD